MLAQVCCLRHLELTACSCIAWHASPCKLWCNDHGCGGHITLPKRTEASMLGLRPLQADSLWCHQGQAAPVVTADCQLATYSKVRLFEANILVWEYSEYWCTCAHVPPSKLHNRLTPLPEAQAVLGRPAICLCTWKTLADTCKLSWWFKNSWNILKLDYGQYSLFSSSCCLPFSPLSE